MNRWAGGDTGPARLTSQRQFPAIHHPHRTGILLATVGPMEGYAGGQTPWEWHPDDELLLVLDGDVSVEVLPPEGPAHQLNLASGQLCTVPAHHWHRQHASPHISPIREARARRSR